MNSFLLVYFYTSFNQEITNVNTLLINGLFPFCF